MDRSWRASGADNQSLNQLFSITRDLFFPRYQICSFKLHSTALLFHLLGFRLFLLISLLSFTNSVFFFLLFSARCEKENSFE